MAQVKFGSVHTIQKLDCLEKYLRAYVKVFKNKPWAETVYIDAFAGTGKIPQSAEHPELPLDQDAQDFIIGSVNRALEIDEGFRSYVFIEKGRGKANALEEVRSKHKRKHIQIMNVDANDGLLELCSQRDWSKTRAVVFLDPFGSQVAWGTLDAIAKTKAVDLWYLFPAGLSIYRQLGTNGSVHYTHEQSLDRILGTTEWRTRFIESVDEAPDLFGDSSTSFVKTATPESVTKFMHERMSTVFEGGVLDEWLPLGRNGGHWYSFMFACANPSPKAKDLAMKLARAVMRSGNRGRSI
ncbi:three-Cys-motif partner protein TcmP [Hyphomicrobium sp.]|jgi:three-Cys-motif partner protein|uniref:three-Cys-motif partner protein TcmP n=1 Tax=Hyphomicrobium sp. TaxID=82 RepID=UPI002BEB510A|nr:three-Cys-motif partner protein TcmP [Hyphomicrobium sp.]HVZ05383.1 three-Cys-motif partner protein TcmP [Hyphomicrobium sp.]